MINNNDNVLQIPKGSFIVIGNELMAVANRSTDGTYFLEDRKKFRYGGVRSKHYKGDPVYAITASNNNNADGLVTGFIKIATSWFYVGISKMYHGGSTNPGRPYFTIYSYTGTNLETENSITGEPHFELVSHDFPGFMGKQLSSR